MAYLTTFPALAHRLQITVKNRVYRYCRSLLESDREASTTSLIKIVRKRLSGRPEVLATHVRSYSKIALFGTVSNQNKDMSGRPSPTKRDASWPAQTTPPAARHDSSTFRISVKLLWLYAG